MILLYTNVIHATEIFGTRLQRARRTAISVSRIRQGKKAKVRDLSDSASEQQPNRCDVAESRTIILGTVVTFDLRS